VSDPHLVFAALADPTRLLLFQRLSAAGPATATGLADDLPVTRQAVVKHLGALADAGLVAKARHGREVRYSLRPEALTEAAHWITDVGAQWDTRLAALKAAAEGTAT